MSCEARTRYEQIAPDLVMSRNSLSMLEVVAVRPDDHGSASAGHCGAGRGEEVRCRVLVESFQLGSRRILDIRARVGSS